MRMVSSAIPIITFRYYPYKRKKLTFWVSLVVIIFSLVSNIRNNILEFARKSRIASISITAAYRNTKINFQRL